MDIERLRFSYDHRRDHLQDIDISLAPGRITTIIGPNGCGKSTLLAVMSGIYAPHAGRVIVDGKAVHLYSPKALASKLAVVHQQNSAPPDIPVERLVGYGRHAHRGWFGGEQRDDREAIEWALACTDLTARRGQTMEQLSGGERQRVWLALALAQQTPYLFLDEPTTYLDMYYQLELLELVKRLNREHGLTIVMVLHDINQAMRYSDRIVAMKEGRIVAAGEPREVITAERIMEIYGVRAQVRTEAELGTFIVPVGI